MDASKLPLGVPVALVLLAAVACLDDPALPTCGDFAPGTGDCAETPCGVYCDEMEVLCPGLFASREACRVSCEDEPPGGVAFEYGTPGETSGNTLSCRISQAVAGACAEAALVDVDQCTDPLCEEYCGIMVGPASPCPDAYVSTANCLDTCRSFDVGADDADANTVRCRLSYARQAVIEPSPATCNAASAGGGGRCGPEPCDVYCDFVEANCTGEQQIFADRTTCMDTCTLLPRGDFDDWLFALERDSVTFRLYHAGPPAAALPAIHCPHARIYNDAHCGTLPEVFPQPAGWPCDTFCTVVQDNCPGVYADRAACEADCRTFPEVTGLPESGGEPALYPVSTLMCPTAGG